MSFVSEIEAMFFTSSVKWDRTIDEKDRVIHVVFVAEFCEKLICDHVRSCRLKLCM